MSTIQQKFILKLPRGYSRETVVKIANRVIQTIKERTAQGLDRNGKAFPKYSKTYEKVKGQSNVDLELSGEMLDQLQVLSVGFSVATIGFPNLAEINGRVEGNRLGSYGGDPDPKKARDFLGITKADLDTILEDFPQTNAEQEEQVRTNIAIAQVETLQPRARRLLIQQALIDEA